MHCSVLHTAVSSALNALCLNCTALFCFVPQCTELPGPPVVDIGSGAGKIRDNGDMCCLATHFLSFFVAQKKQWQCWHLAVVVSVFFCGMNRFKLGDTMVTDWVYLQGHGGSGESSNFFWQLLLQFFGWAHYNQRWVGSLLSTLVQFVNVSNQSWGEGLMGRGQLNFSFFRALLIILSDIHPLMHLTMHEEKSH